MSPVATTRAAAPGTRTRPPSLLGYLAEQVAEMRVPWLARCLVFLAGLLVSWITLKPFPSLSNLDAGDITTGQEGATYVTFGLLALAAIGFALREHAPALRSLLTRSLVALVVWLGLSVLLSQDPSTSAKRLALTGAVSVFAACLPLLAGSRRELRNLLALAAGTLLALCYLGMLLVPHLAIHQPNDFVEPALAGAWRGVFGHKNYAAAVIALVAFIGVGLFGMGARLAGSAIVAASLIFLAGSGGKSATALLVVTFALTGAFHLFRGFAARAAMTLGLVFALNLFSVGTVISEPLGTVVRMLPIDATFTGRTDVWRFAVDAVAVKPLTGYGFSAFWGTAKVRDSSDEGATWAGYAAHSHNGYLDSAVNLGLVGLVLTVLVFLIAPLRHFQRLQEGEGRSDPLAWMFLRIWLFGILLSSMESFFYDRADPLWMTFLFAVFGLHYLARFRTR